VTDDRLQSAAHLRAPTSDRGRWTLLDQVFAQLTTCPAFVEIPSSGQVMVKAASIITPASDVTVMLSLLQDCCCCMYFSPSAGSIAYSHPQSVQFSPTSKNYRLRNLKVE